MALADTILCAKWEMPVHKMGMLKIILMIDIVIRFGYNFRV